GSHRPRRAARSQERGAGGTRRGAAPDRGPRGGARGDQAGSGAVEGGDAPKSRFGVADRMVAEGHGVQVCCRVLAVSESGVYAQRGRAPSPRAIRHAWLTDLITQVHAASNGTYG